MNPNVARQIRIGNVVGVVLAAAGLALVGVRAGAQVASGGVITALVVAAGAAAVLRSAWRWGGRNAAALGEASWQHVLLTGPVAALEVLLWATVVLFAVVLTLMALGAGGAWGDVLTVTDVMSQRLPIAAAATAGLGLVWGVAVAIARRA